MATLGPPGAGTGAVTSLTIRNCRRAALAEAQRALELVRGTPRPKAKMREIAATYR